MPDETNPSNATAPTRESDLASREISKHTDAVHPTQAVTEFGDAQVSAPTVAPTPPPAPVPFERAGRQSNPFADAAASAEERAPMLRDGTHEQFPGAIVDDSLQPPLSNLPGSEPTELYWIGTLPGAPVQNIDLGGVHFPLFCEDVANIAGATQRIRRNGSVVALSETMIKRVHSALRRKVVRWRGADRRKGFLVVIPTDQERTQMAARGRDRPFRSQPNDEPIGRYVYMVKGERTSDSAFPPPIVPRS